jgi:hypothetical protein
MKKMSAWRATKDLISELRLGNTFCYLHRRNGFVEKRKTTTDDGYAATSRVQNRGSECNFQIFTLREWGDESAAGKLQASGNVFRFEIRQFFKDLLLRKTCGQQIQHVDDADAHPTNTGSSATLLGVDRDAFDEFRHGYCFLDREGTAIW